MTEKPRRRLVPRLLRLLCGVVVVVGVLYAFRGPLFSGLLRDRIIAEVHDAAGLTLEIDAISGSWISDLSLEGVRVTGLTDDDELREARVARIDVTFNLLDLLDDPLAGIHSFAITGAHVGIVVNDDPSDWDSTDALLRTIIDLPFDALPPGRVEGFLSILDDDVLIEAGLGVDVAAGRLAVEIQDLLVGLPWGEIREKRLTTTIVPAEGSLRTGGALSGEHFVIEALRLHEDEGRMQLDATLVAGGTIDATLWHAGIDAVLTDVDLARLPAIVESIIGRPLPTGTLTRASVQLRRGEPARFQDLEAQGLDVYGVPIDAASIASGTLDEERVTAETVHAERRGAVVDVDTIALEFDHPLEALTWTNLRAAATDLGSTLADYIDAQEVLRVTSGARLALVSAAVSESRTAVQFEASSARSEAKGTVTLRLPPLPSIDPNALFGALRRVVGRLDASADIDLLDFADWAPESWQLPEMTGRVHLTAAGDDPLSSTSAAVTLSARDLVVNGKRVAALDVSAARAGDFLVIERLHAESEFGDADVAATLSLDDYLVRELTFDARSSDLAALASAFPSLPRVEGSMRLEGSAEGDLLGTLTALRDGRTDLPADARVTIAVSADGLAARGVPLGHLDAALRVVGSTVTIEDCRLDGDVVKLTAEGTARVDGREVDIPVLDAEVLDLQRLAEWLPAVDDIAGSARLKGALRVDDIRDLRDVDGDLEFTSESLTIAGYGFSAILLRARAEAGAIAVTEAHASTPWGSVAGGGTLRVGTERIEATLAGAVLAVDPALLLLDGDPLPVEIRGPVGLAFSADQLDVTDLRASALGGEITGALSIGAELQIDLALKGADLVRLGGDLRGLLDADLHVTGTPAAPMGRLIVSVPRLAWGRDEGHVAIDVRQDATGTTVKSLDVNAGPRLHITGAGYAPFQLQRSGFVRVSNDPSTIRLDADCTDPGVWLERLAPGGTRASSATATIRAEGEALTAHLRAFDLGWIDADDDAGVTLEGETSASIEAGPNGMSAHIEGGSGDFRIAAELCSTTGVDWRTPMRVIDDLRDAPLDGVVRIDAARLRSLGAFIDALHNVTGEGHIDMTVAGTMAAPVLGGAMEVSNVSLRAQADLPAIDQGHMRAVLEGRVVRVERLTARLGYAPIAASGTIDISDLTNPVLDVRITGENARVIRAQHMHARADLDVQVTGPVSSLLIAGEARVTDALYSKPIDMLGRRNLAKDSGFQLFSVREEPWASARFDIHVVADDTLVVDNRTVRGRLSCDLRLRGNGLVPVPTGRISFQDVRVRLPLSRVTVDRGTVDFPIGNPFDPQLRISAFTRLKGYDLDIQIGGGISDGRIMIASSPPLSQEDAMLLLATGSSPDDFESEGMSGVAMTGLGTVLGEATMAWIAGPRRPGEDSIADRVDIEVGRERSETGYATVQADVRILPRWYLRFERDRWDHYDAGLLWKIRFR